MRRSYRWTLILLLLTVGCGACGNGTPERTYAIRGHVVDVAANHRSITIAHQDIPGYMAAMTMPFPVKDSTILEGITVGDEVKGELRVTQREGWLSGLRVIKRATPAPVHDRSKAFPIEYVLQDGDDVPDVGLIDQNEQRFRLISLHGKVVVLTFIFTRCPFPNFCPLMSQRFIEIQRLISGRDRSLLDGVHLLTISFDPYDTPEVLKAYGESLGADIRHWTFATGSEGEVGRFGASFGLSFWTDEGTIVHNLCTVVIRPDGKLQRIFRENNWTAEDVIKEVEMAVRMSI